MNSLVYRYFFDRNQLRLLDGWMDVSFETTQQKLCSRNVEVSD